MCFVAGRNVVAYYDNRFSTIRHINCPFTLPQLTSGNRCSACKTYRDNVLRCALNRVLKQSDNEISVIETSSHANFRYLNTPEKMDRLKNLSKLVRSKEKQIQDLHNRLAKTTETNGVRVGGEVHNDLVNIMNLHKKQHPTTDEKFSSIFWNQQLKAATVKDTRQMRWHPAMIRWCLYIHHRSSGAYSTLRNSGVIKLPSERTLSDYRHHAPSKCGFSVATDMQLLELLKHQKPAHLAKYVTVILDEMYIKEGLVFQKSTGSLIGYEDLGDINNLLHDTEEQINNPGTCTRPLAKLMLVFMVRGTFTSFQFPYAQFPAASTKGSDLFPLFRKVLSRLTRLGIQVMAVTCDGASDNRRMFSLHSRHDKSVYKTINMYSKEGNTIFFISDPPHLIKTIRNCFQRGKLWVSLLCE